MNILNVLSYGGITVLIALLIIFEILNRDANKCYNNGYLYYTHNNIAVRIRHFIAHKYKIYTNDYCPVPTKKDRFGTYFILKARSASEAEYQVDQLYQNS